MRDKNLLQWFLALNAALVGAFAVYLLIAQGGQLKVEPVVFRSTNPLAGPVIAATNGAPPTATASNLATHRAPEPAVALPPGSNAPAQPVFTQKRFTWQDLETPGYRSYLESLRAVGCPEERLRAVVLADVDELFAQKRLKESVSRDTAWWKEEPNLMLAQSLAERGRQLDNERRDLIEKLLGREVLEEQKSEAVFWTSVQLTGEVLGKMPPDKHAAVQEICARSMERHQSAMFARFTDGQGLNAVEMARLREQTRSDLRKLLTPDELEAFLLRYSHNAHQLRYELAAIQPTPEEFRKIFRAVDGVDHALQLEFGGLEALSAQQRERYQRQRDDAIRGALPPERYQAYLLGKDPLFRQAQTMAMQYGAPAKAVLPLYEMAKANQTKQREILTNTALSEQQKNAALQALSLEQHQLLQRLVIEAMAQKQPN